MATLARLAAPVATGLVDDGAGGEPAPVPEGEVPLTPTPVPDGTPEGDEPVPTGAVPTGTAVVIAGTVTSAEVGVVAAEVVTAGVVATVEGVRVAEVKVLVRVHGQSVMVRVVAWFRLARCQVFQRRTKHTSETVMVEPGPMGMVVAPGQKVVKAVTT